MKNINNLVITLIFIAFLMPIQLKAQNNSLKTDSAHLLIDTILKFTKVNSLYSKSVNWQTIEDSVRKSAATAVTIKEALPSVQLLYKLLGDHHGFITYGDKTYRWDAKTNPLDRAIHQALIKKGQEVNTVKSCILDRGYGYLFIPNNNPTHPGDVSRIAQQIRDTLMELNSKKLKGLIIDLRVDYGGNSSAVLAGLAPLFKQGKLGAFISPNGDAEDWGVKDGKAYAGTDTTQAVNGSNINLNNLKVVILIGPYTRSSGEVAAISFKGRKRTLFIGENSGGYTTSNNSFQFTNDVGFFTAGSVEADINGNVYFDYVKPDIEIIGGDDFIDLKKDFKIIKALQWLKTN